MISPNESEGHLKGYEVSKDAEMPKKVEGRMVAGEKRTDDDAFLKWVLYGVWAVVVILIVFWHAKVVLVEMHKTEQIRMLLELEKLRGTQMEKGTLGKKSAKKSEVEF